MIPVLLPVVLSDEEQPTHLHSVPAECPESAIRLFPAWSSRPPGHFFVGNCECSKRAPHSFVRLIRMAIYSGSEKRHSLAFQQAWVPFFTSCRAPSNRRALNNRQAC